MAECRCYRCHTDMFADSYTDPSMWIGDNGVEDIEEMFCDDCHHVILHLIKQRNMIIEQKNKMTCIEYDKAIDDINYKLTHDVFVPTPNLVFKKLSCLCFCFVVSLPFLLIIACIFKTTN